MATCVSSWSLGFAAVATPCPRRAAGSITSASRCALGSRYAARLIPSLTYWRRSAFCRVEPSHVLGNGAPWRVLGVRAISTNELKNGTNLEIDGAPWRVLEFLHVKPGKGAAFVRTKLKNYVTGNTVDRTFRANEQVALAEVQKDMKQFSYMDGDQFVFMDMETYEEVRLTSTEVGDRTKFLKEGMECSVLSWNDKVIDMDLPVTLKLKVTRADPGVKGDSAQGGTKVVTLETGAQVTVPLFVNQDDSIIIQSKDGTYISRA